MSVTLDYPRCIVILPYRDLALEKRDRFVLHKMSIIANKICFKYTYYLFSGLARNGQISARQDKIPKRFREE